MLFDIANQAWRDLEQALNESSETVFELTGEAQLNIDCTGTLVLGKNFCKSIFTVKRPGIVIDGRRAKFVLHVSRTLIEDCCIFYLTAQAKAVSFVNCNFDVLYEGDSCEHRLIGIYNNAFDCRVSGCRMEIEGHGRADLVGIFNNGNLDTHMETRADNLSVEDCFLKVTQLSADDAVGSQTCAVHNHLANSVVLRNNFIYSTNRGSGERHRAVGVFNSGRFARILGNNIKANGTHNVGRSLEQAHVYGVINEGLYTLFSDNNCVGEWGGQCVGLENSGEYMKIQGNKILATHTIKGRSIRNTATKCLILGNVITSTSRNPKLIENSGWHVVIAQNIIEALQPPDNCFSGAGICFHRCESGIVCDNQILNPKNCGVFLNYSKARVEGNEIYCAMPYAFQPVADENDAAVAAALDDALIRSAE